jgi:transcriptional regulator of acetoin/glycerol metabolism
MPQVLPTSLLESRAARLDLARQRFFDEGLAPTGVVSEAVFESWARCLRLRHSPSDQAVFQPVTASRAHLALQKNRQLYEAWLHELPRLEAVLGISACAAMLTDSTGVLIGATCAGRSHEELMPVATRVGVDLSEGAVGTTAPGIVIRTGKPVRVLGGEHFFEGVTAMYCSAAPIRDVGGAIAGVLDISSESIPFGFDAASVVGLYAGAIENRLLIRQSTDHLVIRFQVSPELLDSALVALVGIDAKGCVAWQNGAARGLLGMHAPNMLPARSSTEQTFGTELRGLTALPEHGAGLLMLPNGLMVWARAEMHAPDGRRGLVQAPCEASSGPAQPMAPAAIESHPAHAAAEPRATQLAGAMPVEDQLVDAVEDAATSLGTAAGTLRETDREVIEHTLERCGGNVSEAARLLGVSRGLIYRRMRPAAEACVLKRNNSPGPR